MSTRDRHHEPPWEEPEVVTDAVGPPGWEEFAGARARFMRTLALQALEGSWAAPAGDPRAIARRAP
jgi:hypothetical protein